ncbi:MAG: hypothetical protein ABI718_05885 [Acidobacteriota bacterium]
MATWFRRGRGLALGVLVGALTLGKASPYLVNTFGSGDWRFNVGLASMFAVAGAAIVLFLVRDGPFSLPSQPFDFSQVTSIVSNRGVRLANIGYFGHMWELYAMWIWAPVMIRASLNISGDAPRMAEMHRSSSLARAPSAASSLDGSPIGWDERSWRQQRWP